MPRRKVQPAPKRTIANDSPGLPPSPCWSSCRRGLRGRATGVSSAPGASPITIPLSLSLAALSSQDPANLFSLPPPPPPPPLPAGGPASSSSTSSSSWISSAPCLFPLCPCPGFLSACSRLHPGAALVPVSRALSPGPLALHPQASCLPPPAPLSAPSASWPGEEGRGRICSMSSNPAGHL